MRCFGEAAIYARVSSDDGRQSPANQIQQLRELASVRQFEIIREYVDEETGASASRHAFLQLFRDARLRRFRVLLISDLDRLTREGAAAGFRRSGGAGPVRGAGRQSWPDLARLRSSRGR